MLTSNNNFNLFTANIKTKESLRPLVSKSFFNKITVIYANINPQEIERSKIVGQESDEIYRKYGLPANKFLVFCVGQFIDRKGRWIFLEAARQLLKENNEFAFVWISYSKRSSTDLEKAKS